MYGLPSYLIAVDLGQAADYTAIVVAERTETPAPQAPAGLMPAQSAGPAPLVGSYALIHLGRFELGTPYTVLPDELRALEDVVRRRFTALGAHRRQSVTFAQASLETVVDMTGVGRPVVDLLRQAGLDPVAVTITAGHEVTRVDRREYRTPKRDLVAAVQTTMQARRLKAAESLPLWPVLRQELQNFRARISLAGHDSYDAGDDWREGNHDDLVLATALAVWFGEYRASHRSVTYSASYLDVPAEDDDDVRPIWARERSAW